MQTKMNSVIFGNMYSGPFVHPFFLVVLMVLAGSVLHGQNLISNPGFEKCERCGMFGNSGVELSLGIGANNPVDWYGVTYGTSDFRPEQPNSGKYHGGFFSFGKFEYLGNVLSAPLVAGAEYELTCFMGTRFDSEFTLDEVGFCFQQGLNTYPVSGPLTRLSPQVTTPDGDFLPYRSYKKYALRFIACGGEDHLIIGRFKELSRGDTVFVGTKRTGSAITYTIIDDLELKIVNQAPDLIPDRVEICRGFSRKIGLKTGIVAERVIWSNGTSADSIILDGNDSLVWVEVILSDGCAPIRDTARIVVSDLSPNLLQDTVFLCPGQVFSILPDSSGFMNPIWSHGPVSFKTELPGPGLFYLEADSPCGLIRDSVWALSADLLPAELLSFEDTCYFDGLVLSAPVFVGARYSWSDGTMEAEMKPKGPGVIYLVATGACNQVIDSILIRGGLKLDSLFLIPNVFTPNGDRENDSFRPIVRSGLESLLVDYQLRIFNRWGKMLFETQDHAQPWIPDQDTGTETYLYQLKARYRDCPIERTSILSGAVSIIR